MLHSHQILQMHANWLASLLHPGLAEETSRGLTTVIRRVEALVESEIQQPSAFDLSKAWSQRDLCLALQACETALAHFEVLAAASETISSLSHSSASDEQEIGEIVNAVRAQRDEIAAHIYAAELFHRLTAQGRTAESKPDSQLG